MNRRPPVSLHSSNSLHARFALGALSEEEVKEVAVFPIFQFHKTSQRYSAASGYPFSSPRERD